MTDAERMLELLRLAGPAGVHTHDLRRRGISGNPSQRRLDLIAQGHEIDVRREARGKRPGARYTLISEAAAESSGARDERPVSSPTHTGQAGPDASSPLAGAGQLFEVPPPRRTYASEEAA